MVSDADKAKQTTYTTDDIMEAILGLRKDNSAIQEINKAIQDSVAVLEIRVKALEVNPGGQAGLYPPPKDLAPVTSQLPLSTSSAAANLAANLTTVASATATAPATASSGLPTMSLPLGQQRPLPAWSSVVTPQAPPVVSIFTSGLIDLLKIDVELHNPQDMDTAMSLACAHELRAKVAAGAIIEASSSDKSSMPTGQLQGQHEVLASGPIEDLIAHREHRYRISGSQLLAAMDMSSSVPHSELLSARAGESQMLDKQEQISLSQGKEEALSRLDDRNGRTQQTVDVAEILRRWTHALQRIHKQSLHLAKTNDGDGPELLRSASDGEASTHADSLTATLAEHRQHLVSIQGLINQLKEAIPAMQQSITDLSGEVNSVPRNPVDQTNSRQLLSGQNTGFVRPEESSSEVSGMTSKLSSTHIDKAVSSPALKLPPLFSLTPSSSGKGTQTLRRNALARQPSQEILPQEKTLALSSTKDQGNSPMHENYGYFAHDIRRSVREAALSKPLSNTESPQDNSSDDGSEHFFIPLSSGASRKDVGAVANRRKQKIVLSPSQTKLPMSTSDQYLISDGPMHTTSALSSKWNGHGDSSSAGNLFEPVSSQLFMTDDALDQVFSPPLLLESSLFHDTYEDLLGKSFQTA
ncbi:hypothetical protein ACQ4PT_052928 [Festuca glaucescens]